jgi:hypothetical protein
MLSFSFFFKDSEIGRLFACSLSLSLVLCLSLLKYCHGFFWFKSQDIYLIVLAAVLEGLRIIPKI